MTLANDIVSDIDGMIGDWGDSITISATPYDCLYNAEYVEINDIAGYEPTVTMKTTDATAASVTRGTSVTVTSVIAGINNKSFTVAVPQDMHDGTIKLILEEA